jgi:hypothetical protein
MSRSVTQTATKQQSPPAGSTAERAIRRRHRHRDRRRQRRREGFLREVVESISPGVLSPDDAMNLFCGGLTAARCALKRLRRIQPANFPSSPFAKGVPKPDLSSAVRPVPRLSRLNRSSIFPSIVKESVTIDFVRASDVLALVRARCKTEPPHRLLDVFAVSTGLSWELCAEILLAHQLIPAPITQHQIAVVKSARLFWVQYSHGRTRFASLAASSHVPQFRGDWAYFDHSDLEILLPGIVIPTRLKRYDYLTNYGLYATGFSLDVYAASTGSPLFQHQFPFRFNPLHFGLANVR